MHYYIGPIQIYSGAEVSHTNRCRSVLVPKCLGAEVSRERLTKCAAHLGKCAAHLGKRTAQLAKCACIWPFERAFGQMRNAFGVNGQTLRIWPNVRAFGQMRAHLTKRCAFGQMLRIWSNAARFTNWSDALCIWPNAQIGQMHLTSQCTSQYS